MADLTLSELTQAFEFTLAVQGSGSILRDAIKAALSENGASLLTKFEDLAKRRQVVYDFPPNPLLENQAVYSPIMKALEDLYCTNDLSHAPGRTYVMYAPSCQGKTSGAMLFLEKCLPLFKSQDEKEIPTAHGIMITGTPGKNYFKFMSERLKTDSCKDWIFSLIAALAPNPSEPDRLPSILILDAMNTWSEVNEEFVEKLFMATDGKGFYTVILSQNEEFARDLCSKNDGKKICALPAAYDTGTPMVPIWNKLQWGEKLLEEMLKRRFPHEWENWLDSGGTIPWVQEEWTPSETIWAASCRITTPPSPKRARLLFEQK